MKIESIVRKNILQLKPYTSAREDHLTGILLDANENSFGPVVNDEWNIGLNRYPDPFHNKLREELASYLSMRKENLFIGVGSDEIIDLTIRIFCEPKIDNVITLEPTYGMYKVVCDINDVSTISLPLNNNFQIDLEKVYKAITTNTKVIFICSPNNPTGNLIEPKSIMELAEKFNGIVFVDEAYIDFASQDSLIAKVGRVPNLIVTRTFSKAWGLAGVRCGFCASSKEIINLLYKIKMPYNLNKLTSEVILHALKNYEQKDKFVQAIKNERKFIKDELNSMPGITKVYPSETNYILFECENPSSVYTKLIEIGIVIRDRSSQVKNSLRVSVGTREENIKFLNGLKDILAG